MKNWNWKLVAAIGAAIVAISTLPTVLSAFAPEQTAEASTASTVAGQTSGINGRTKSRVTFHYSHPPGPRVSALIGKYAGTSVVVQRQHFVHKCRIALPVENSHDWIFQREKLRMSLLRLRQSFENEWDPDNPQFSTLMLDLEPHWDNLGHSRIDVMQDALGMCLDILGQSVQVGFQGNPHQRGLNSKGVPPIRIYDSILSAQGAIFIHARFSSRGNNWVTKGMALTKHLLDRVEPIRDGRPTIAIVAAERSDNTRSGLIPDDVLIEQLRLLVAANVEICVYGLVDAETAHVIELARRVILEK